MTVTECLGSLFSFWLNFSRIVLVEVLVVLKALARTLVYLSKTKLRNTGEDLAIYILKVQ